MVTLKQVAEAAQVSRGTVDRVLHGRTDVNPETRAKVLKILKELDYKPNVMGRALKGMQNSYRIGAIIPDRANRFWIDVYKGLAAAEKMANAYGIEIVCMNVEEMNAENLTRCIDQLEALSVNGIMMVAIDHPAVRERINALPESIPVITYNSDIEDTKRMCFVGNDHLMAGRTAGHLMKLVTKGQAGKIGILISHHEWLAHEERSKGFMDHYSRIGSETDTIIGPFCTYENEKTAYEITRDLLRNEPELIGIYVAGGGQEGAALALGDSDRKGEVHMICHDLLPVTVNAVLNGSVDFTLGQEAFEQGYIPVEIFRDYLMLGKSPVNNRIFTRIDIRSAENIQLKGSEMFLRASDP